MEFIRFFKRHKTESVLFFFILLYISYFTLASFLRYDNFYTGRYDLGNMVQAVWNTKEGRIFQDNSPDELKPVSRLGGHADFILVLIAPLYMLWEDPKLLLFLQSLVLSLGSLFVYLISVSTLKNKLISLTFAIAFLLNPAVQYTNLYDFHAVTFATTFLLAAFYFIIKEKYLYTVIFLILSGLTKENVWLITSFFGIYIFFFKKLRFLGSFIFLVSILFFYYLMWIAIPQASVRGKHFVIDYYSRFGSTPIEILRNILFNPFETLKILAGESRLEYLKQLLAPLGALAIYSPFILFALPELALILLSQNPLLHQIYYQYTATITPFIFISAIYATKLIFDKYPKFPIWILSAYVFLFSVLSAYSYGPLPFAKKPNDAMFKNQLSYADRIDKYLEKIDREYSVASTNNLGSHLSERRFIFTLPLGLNKADYVLFLIRKPYDEEYKKEDLKVLEKVKTNKNYILIYEYEDFVVFKKAGLN